MLRDARLGMALVLAIALAACKVADVDLDGKPCPCVDGYSCDTATNTCTRAQAIDAPQTTDAPPDVYVPDGLVTTTKVIGMDASELRDAEMYEQDPTANYNGVEVSCDLVWTGLVWLDLSSIPTNKTIVSATLHLRVTDYAATSGGTVNLHRLRESWTETGVTFASRNGTDAWSSPGARGAARDATPFATMMPAAIDTTYDIPVPAQLIQDWVADPSQNLGFSIVRGNTTEHIHFGAREGAIWTRLTVEYY